MVTWWIGQWGFWVMVSSAEVGLKVKTGTCDVARFATHCQPGGCAYGKVFLANMSGTMETISKTIIARLKVDLIKHEDKKF